MTTADNQRRFQRIPLDSVVRILQGDRAWTSVLCDISLNGALVKQPPDWLLETGAPCRLEILLSPEVAIVMEVTLVHQEDQRVGFRCDHIDLESVSELRRVVEMNLGNATLLYRELEQLSHVAEAH